MNIFGRQNEFKNATDFYEWLWNNWGCLGRKVPGEDIKKYRKFVRKLKKEGWIKKDSKGNWSLKKDWNIVVKELNEETKKKCELYNVRNAREFYTWLWHWSEVKDGLRVIEYKEAKKYKHYLKSLEQNSWIEKKDEECWILKRDYDKYREVECAYWMAFKKIRRINTVDLEDEDFVRVLLECGIIEPTYKIVVPREYYKIMSGKFGNYWLDEEE